VSFNGENHTLVNTLSVPRAAMFCGCKARPVRLEVTAQHRVQPCEQCQTVVARTTKENDIMASKKRFVASSTANLQTGKDMKPSQVEPGMKGVMATCVKGKEKFATRELFTLFNEYADALYGSEQGESEQVAASIEDAFAQEVQALSKPKTRFTALLPGMPCCIFIRTKDPVDPVQLVDAILQDLQTKQMHKTRYALLEIANIQTCQSIAALVHCV